MGLNAPGKELIGRRHPEYLDNHLRWRFLLDSLEGGDRYRNATYGTDRSGRLRRNLVRHKREFTDPRDLALNDAGAVYMGGLAQTNQAMTANAGDGPAPATDNDYELRRSRTPSPAFVHEAVETHLSKIYSREVLRKGPPELMTWWEDVDGQGTTVDDWMGEVVGPLLLTLGQLDIITDRPAAPEGEEIRSEADVKRLKLDRCVAGYILPENLPWWRTNPDGTYAECLVREWVEDPTAGPPKEVWRNWTLPDWTLYDGEGEILDQGPHPYGRIPIRRVFDRRKFRSRNIGQSRYESIAEVGREFYNRDSELILSDTLQAHPLLQGPEEFCQVGGSIPIGPGYLLPKKRNAKDGGDATYEGFEVIEFPKGGAESIRQNKQDLRDEVDRAAKMTKPAGTSGSTRGTVSQSGISKQLDNVDGCVLLSKLAKTLARFETLAAEMAWVVLKGKDKEPPGLEVTYPASFDLMDANEFGLMVQQWQLNLGSAGKLPDAEWLLLEKHFRLMLPGLADAEYERVGEQLRTYLEQKAAEDDRRAEAMAAALESQTANTTGASADDLGSGAGPGDEGGGAGNPDVAPYSYAAPIPY